MRSGILSMPVDVVAIVASKLSFQDLLILGMSCRSLHSVASSDIVWIDKCKVWENEIKLEEWLRGASCARALFRLLRNLSKLKGVWSSQDLGPRGSLLYMTWGCFSLGAWKVEPQSLARVSFAPLFEVIGLPDGSTKVEAVSRELNSRLPATLQWISHGEFEILVANNPKEAEVTTKHFFPEYGEVSMNQHDASFGVRTIQFFRRLATPTPSRASKSGITFSYRKIDLESDPEQKLAGLWSGIYGPHGLEILAVQYINSKIVGLKILGDTHVPCNTISFQVDFETKSSTITPELQSLADMLAIPGGQAARIVTVYEGNGKIAGFNYTDPQWVPGKLLLHDNGSMSFLWENVNFVIRFHKLELPSLFRSNGHDQVLPKRL